MSTDYWQSRTIAGKWNRGTREQHDVCDCQRGDAELHDVCDWQYSGAELHDVCDCQRDDAELLAGTYSTSGQ